MTVWKEISPTIEPAWFTPEGWEDTPPDPLDTNLSLTHITPARALWANKVQRECLLEAGDDVEAGLAAAAQILALIPVDATLSVETNDDTSLSINDEVVDDWDRSLIALSTTLEEWSPYLGVRGANKGKQVGWKHVSGRIVYGLDRPGGRGKAQAAPAPGVKTPAPAVRAGVVAKPQSVAKPLKAAKPAKVAPPDKQQVLALVQAAMKQRTPDGVKAALNGLMGLKLPEMRAVLAAAGVKGKGRAKSDLAKLVENQVNSQPVATSASAAKPAPVPTPKPVPAPVPQQPPAPTPKPPDPAFEARKKAVEQAADKAVSPAPTPAPAVKPAPKPQAPPTPAPKPPAPTPAAPPASPPKPTPTPAPVPAQIPKPPAPQAAPKPPPAQAAPISSPARKSVIEKMVAGLNGSDVSGSGQREHFDGVKRILSRMPEGVFDRLAANLDTINFCDDPQHLTSTYVKKMFDELNAQKPVPPALKQPLKDHLASQFGLSTAGVCLTPKGGGKQSVLSDSIGMKPQSSTGTRFEQGVVSEGTTSHELTHVIDGPGNQLSKSTEWTTAFNEEIANGPGVTRDNPKRAKLSEYGGRVTNEGFAEFGRVLYGTDIPLDVVERTFPKCSSFFKARGLWPKPRIGGKALSTNEAEPDTDDTQDNHKPFIQDIFNDRMDLPDGSHADRVVEKNQGDEGNDAAFANFDPNQPRRPVGDPEGGEWVTVGGYIHPSTKVHMGGLHAKVTSDGTVTAGPLKGHSIRDVKKHFESLPSDKHRDEFRDVLYNNATVPPTLASDPEQSKIVDPEQSKVTDPEQSGAGTADPFEARKDAVKEAAAQATSKTSESAPAPNKPPRPLTNQETEALGVYQAVSPDYSLINGSLRRPGSNLSGATVSARSGPMALSDAIKHLDSAMEASPTQQPVSVTRGMTLNINTNVAQMFQVGGTFTDKGFVSTSTNSKIGEDFSEVGDDEQGVIMHVDVPKGTPSHNYGGKEGELLLHRNSKFRVKSASQDADGVWHVHLDHIGKGD